MKFLINSYYVHLINISITFNIRRNLLQFAKSIHCYNFTKKKITSLVKRRKSTDKNDNVAGKETRAEFTEEKRVRRQLKESFRRNIGIRSDPEVRGSNPAGATFSFFFFLFSLLKVFGSSQNNPLGK